MTDISISISIGICTSNDEKTINRLLFNLTKTNRSIKNSEDKQNKFFPVKIKEIIIVSSGCIDSTEEIIDNYVKEFPNLIILISEKNRKGKSSALNKIFQIYSSDYLVLIPADALTSLTNISLLIKRMNNNKKVGIAFGNPIIDHQSHHCSTICKMNSSIWNLHTQGMSLKGNTHASGELMALRRDSVVLIPENIINDDAYLSQLSIEKKRKIEFVQSSIVLITSPITFKDYIKQRKRIYLGHKQLKGLRSKQTIPFNKLLAHNKFFYLKTLMQEINTIKKLAYLNLALIVELYLKLCVKFNLNKQFTNINVWERITVDFSSGREILNNLD